MAEKHKKTNWTAIIIVAIIVLGIAYIVNLGTSYDSLENENYNYDGQINSDNYNSKIIEIDLVGSSQTKTINNPNQIISIDLTGSNNKISVTKETQISLIDVVGSNNLFTLCKNHSPKIDETGSGNVFNYLDC